MKGCIPVKKIIRRSTETDIARLNENKAREKEALVRSRAMARHFNLDMKLAEVEIQADGKKATFYYTADDRVDFRELIRAYAGEFKVKVEMRQIGARQEAGKVGGISTCGRELCCATWLTDFKSVNTTAARYQNLSINQTKLSGQCGRLKCCLNYELDTYLDALQHFPDNADVLQITRSPAYLVKKDIFKNLMWYTTPDSAKHYPLTITRVKEIQRMNAQGQKPDELEPVEIVSSKPKEFEDEFVDVVGQISLKSLEKNSRKRKERDQQKDNRGGDRRNDGQPRTNQQPDNRNNPQRNPQNQPNQQNKPGEKPRNAGPENQNRQAGTDGNKPKPQNPPRNNQQQPGQQPKNNPPKQGGNRNPDQRGQQQNRQQRPPQQNNQQKGGNVNKPDNPTENN